MLDAYVAGIDPTDPEAFFEITGGDARTGALWWNAVAGRMYIVYWTTNLLDGFSPILTNYTGGSVTDTLHRAESQGFYQLKVQMDE